MNWTLLAVLSATTGGGVTIGALFGPFRDHVHRQTYCVVRIYKRPEGYETLYESRLPKASQRYLAAHQDGTLTVMLKTEVDKANADAMRKRAWWADFRTMMDAIVTLRQQQARGVEEDRLDEIQETQTVILQRLDALTGTAPVAEDVVIQWQDPAPLTAANRDGALAEYGEEGSVMPAMAPTEAIDREALRREAERLAAATARPKHHHNRPIEPKPYRFEEDPVPTQAGGIGKVPNTTRTVVLPLGEPGLLKRPDDSVGGER